MEELSLPYKTTKVSIFSCYYHTLHKINLFMLFFLWIDISDCKEREPRKINYKDAYFIVDYLDNNCKFYDRFLAYTREVLCSPLDIKHNWSYCYKFSHNCSI